MNIALFTNNDDDVYCFRLELIQAILSAGYSLLISCPYGPKFDQMEKEGLRKGIDFDYDDPPIDRRGTNLFRDGKLIVHYFKLLKKINPAVVLTYTAKPNVYVGLAARLLSIPVVSNVTGLGSVTEEKGLKQRFILRLFKNAFRSSAFVMFQNQANLDLACKLGWVRGEYRLIPGSGVNLARFPVQPYPEGNGPIIFNYIGRILHDKGVDDYIEAAKRIRAYYPQTEFNLLGFIEPTESYYEQKLASLEKEGIVYYRGSQVDVRPWIKRSHCVIHPSTYGEGMSNVLLENAASARPIITTDNPGCQEAVVNGESGFVYCGGDVDALTDAIVRFLKMPNEQRAAMGLAGRSHVSRYFSRDIVVGEYLDVIRHLTGEHL